MNVLICYFPVINWPALVNGVQDVKADQVSIKLRNSNIGLTTCSGMEHMKIV